MSYGYIYAHLDPRVARTSFDSEHAYLRAAVAYIGATTDPAQRLEQHIYSASADSINRHYQWLASLLQAGYRPVQLILDSAGSAEALAELETRTIDLYLRIGCTLTNHRDRGGYTQSVAAPLRGFTNASQPIKTVEDQIRDFLNTSPKRTLSEICNKLERKTGAIRNTLRAMERDGTAHCLTDKGGRNPLWCDGPKPWMRDTIRPDTTTKHP